MIFDIPSELGFEMTDDRVKFHIDEISTNWMSDDDSFTKRIDKASLNPRFLKKHLIKEIEIKNTLDMGIDLFKSAKYQKAVECFDEVLFYDPDYAEALMYKSFCFKGQKHFVKSLRHYKKAISKDAGLKDDEYYRELLRCANDERASFPKLKLNIYAGDEYFSKGDFKNALESYNRALENPSKFRDKILTKLLNKKGTALMRLNEYEEALECFKNSDNDYSYFAGGICEYRLGVDVNERFKSFLNIDKSQMLKQAQTLNELELFVESLAICDYLMENHFKVDEFYHNLLNAKKIALLNLNDDASDLQDLISQLF